VKQIRMIDINNLECFLKEIDPCYQIQVREEPAVASNKVTIQINYARQQGLEFVARFEYDAQIMKGYQFGFSGDDVCRDILKRLVSVGLRHIRRTNPAILSTAYAELKSGGKHEVVKGEDEADGILLNSINHMRDPDASYDYMMKKMAGLPKPQPEVEKVNEALAELRMRPLKNYLELIEQGEKEKEAKKRDPQVTYSFPDEMLSRIEEANKIKDENEREAKKREPFWEK